MYVIERGIPPPPATHARRGNERSHLLIVLGRMDVGESFLVETDRERAEAVRRFAWFESRQFAARKVAGQGWRIWRIE